MLAQIAAEAEIAPPAETEEERRRRFALQHAAADAALAAGRGPEPLPTVVPNGAPRPASYTPDPAVYDVPAPDEDEPRRRRFGRRREDENADSSGADEPQPVPSAAPAVRAAAVPRATPRPAATYVPDPETARSPERPDESAESARRRARWRRREGETVARQPAPAPRHAAVVGRARPPIDVEDTATTPLSQPNVPASPPAAPVPAVVLAVAASSSTAGSSASEPVDPPAPTASGPTVNGSPSTDVRYRWQRRDAVDLDLRGAQTWDPGQYPPEPEPTDDAPAARRALRWLFARADSPPESEDDTEPASPVRPPSRSAGAAAAQPAVLPQPGPALLRPGTGTTGAAAEESGPPAAAEPPAAKRPNIIRRLRRVDEEDDGPFLPPDVPTPSTQAGEDTRGTGVVDSPRPRPSEPRFPASRSGATPKQVPVKPVPPASTPAIPSAGGGPRPAAGKASTPSPRPPSTASAAPRPRPRPGGAPSGASQPSASSGGSSKESEHPGSDTATASETPAKGTETDPPAKEAGSGDADSKPSLRQRLKVSRIGRVIVRLAIIALVAVIAAFVLRAYVVAPYYIPSASMEPTLHGCPGCDDDHVLVDKISYRLHDPHQGDIVVFDRPPGVPVSEDVLIKRIVATPGDVVTLRDGFVYINGGRYNEPYLNKACGPRASKPLTRTTRWKIPPGDVFVLGDNRCDSTDSRAFGPIPESSIEGRAFAIIYPFKRIGTL